MANIAQPLLITFLMRFFEPCSTMSVWEAWFFASATVLAGVCLRIVDHWVSVASDIGHLIFFVYSKFIKLLYMVINYASPIWVLSFEK